MFLQFEISTAGFAHGAQVVGPQSTRRVAPALLVTERLQGSDVTPRQNPSKTVFSVTTGCRLSGPPARICCKLFLDGLHRQMRANMCVLGGVSTPFLETGVQLSDR